MATQILAGGDNPDDRHSTTGYVFLLADAAISRARANKKPPRKVAQKPNTWDCVSW